MKLLLLLLFSCIVIDIKAQRTTFNKDDRKYLCDKLNSSITEAVRKLGVPVKKNFFDMNDRRLLTDTFSFKIVGQTEPCDGLEPQWTKHGINFAICLFLNGVNEFPQYRAINLFTECEEKKEIKATYLIKDRLLVYFDEGQKKWVTCDPYKFRIQNR